MSAQSELTVAADRLATVVARMLPADISAELTAEFRAALGDLLAATLGGATVMAAGAVVMLDTKVERLAKIRSEGMQAIQREIGRISDRVHALEDAFLPDGTVGTLTEAMHRIASDVERLKEREAGGAD